MLYLFSADVNWHGNSILVSHILAWYSDTVNSDILIVD
jgi:hypothetical protein